MKTPNPFFQGEGRGILSLPDRVGLKCRTPTWIFCVPGTRDGDRESLLKGLNLRWMSTFATVREKRCSQGRLAGKALRPEELDPFRPKARSSESDRSSRGERLGSSWVLPGHTHSPSHVHNPKYFHGFLGSQEYVRMFQSPLCTFLQAYILSSLVSLLHAQLLLLSRQLKK